MARRARLHKRRRSVSLELRRRAGHEHPDRTCNIRLGCAGRGVALGVENDDGVYRTLFERSTMPLWVVDEETRRFLAVNDAAIEKYGWSREEFLAMRLDDLACDDDDNPSRADFRSYVPEPRPGAFVLGPLRHRRKDGSRLDVRIEV